MSEAVGTTEVDVYQLYRGNHREEDDARAAEEIRHQIRCHDRTEIDTREFDRLWEHRGTETFEADNEGDILAGIWRRWNYSSGQESRAFVEAKTRSMEVGDVVAFDGNHYLCLPIGWEVIEVGQEEQVPFVCFECGEEQTIDAVTHARGGVTECVKCGEDTEINPEARSR